MDRKVINFGAGPAKLPEEVLTAIAAELHSHQGSGVSILEMSHRSAEFKQVLQEATQLLKELMEIPDTHEVLFMHGGGSGQFAAVPLNLAHLSGDPARPEADFLVTGAWSRKAAAEAAKYVRVHRVLEEGGPAGSVPPEAAWRLHPGAAFLWYCANETIDGVEFHGTPQVPEDVNLVADISSNILSRPIDVAKHAVIIAGTQKNLGIGGLTLVVLRKELAGRADPRTPGILNYQEMLKHESLIYVTLLVLRWIRRQGGVQSMARRAEQKAALLYATIDGSGGFYSAPVAPAFRSRMNVPFRVGGGDPNLEASFLEQAERRGMLSLKGHRSVGGVRASIYNAVTLEEVQQLTDFMRDFQSQHEKH